MFSVMLQWYNIWTWKSEGQTSLNLPCDQVKTLKTQQCNWHQLHCSSQTPNTCCHNRTLSALGYRDWTVDLPHDQAETLKTLPHVTNQWLVMLRSQSWIHQWEHVFECFGYKVLCTALHFWQFNHILLLIHDTLLHLPCVSLIQLASLPLGRVAGSTGLEILRSCSSVYSSGFLGIFPDEFTVKNDQILKKIAVKWNIGVTKANKIQIWRLLQEVNKSTWVSSAAGSTEYSQYSLNQGLLMQNQLIYHSYHSGIVCIYWNIYSYYYLHTNYEFYDIYPVFIY